MSPDGTGSADGADLSRRAFVLAGGAAAGVAFGSAGGSASETGTGQRAVEVAVTAPYRSSVREAVEAFERTASAPEVRLRPAKASPDADTDADVRISGRPTPEGSAETTTDAVADGWAALATPDGEWRECLGRQSLRERRTADAPVETWSETDWSSVGDLERSTLRTGGTAPSTLVYGTRSYQYARGEGGVGYYGVDRDALETATGEGVSALRSGGYSPVVRVGYRHATAAARDDEDVAALLRVHDRSTADVSAVTDDLDPAP